jgi:hypothetical protein
MSDEYRQAVLRAALSMYLGEACKYCGCVYHTLEDLYDTVWAGYHARGRLACRECWERNKPQ